MLHIILTPTLLALSDAIILYSDIYGVSSMKVIASGSVAEKVSCGSKVENTQSIQLCQSLDYITIDYVECFEYFLLKSIK